MFSASLHHAHFCLPALVHAHAIVTSRVIPASPVMSRIFFFTLACELRQDARHASNSAQPRLSRIHLTVVPLSSVITAWIN